MIKEVNDITVFNEIADGLSIVKTYIPTQSPSKVMDATFRELSEIYPDIKFLAIDVSVHQIFANLQNVKITPTFVFLKHGHIIAMKTGIIPKRNFEVHIKSAFRLHGK